MNDVGYTHDLVSVWIFRHILNHICRRLFVTPFSCLIAHHPYCIEVCIGMPVLSKEQDILISLRKVVSYAAADVVFLVPNDVLAKDITRLNESICKTMGDP